MRLIAGLSVLVLILTTTPLALAQFQQQAKLIGSGAVGTANQGISVALSADGGTAAVGGPIDNAGSPSGPFVGAVWIFMRSGGVWTQQAKLVASDAIGGAAQGASVALSSNGNTLIVGGNQDNGGATGVGAAWVWTRSGSTWTEQQKLIANDSVGGSQQGASVAISADGNTAIVGGAGDNGGDGAAWIWTRSGTTWTQQGTKLFGTGATGSGINGPRQGQAVALSADGNTAVVGGYADTSSYGAIWIWTRSGTTWTQQGPKLSPSDAAIIAWAGFSVAISADGNTAAAGGMLESAATGAAWVWTRSGSTWTQQGAKLVGSGASGQARQGTSVALSGDGNILLVGAYTDSPDGATWIWTRSGGAWTQKGSKFVGSGGIGGPHQGFSVALSSDASTALVGGWYDNNFAGAAWAFGVSDLTITKTHASVFRAGDTGDAFTITVTNSGAAATSGPVTVTDTMPAGLTPTAPNGSVNGWNCSIVGQVLTCSRSDTLAPGASYPAITATVSVAANATGSLVNTAIVSGGAEIAASNDAASDPTPVVALTAQGAPTVSPWMLLLMGVTLATLGVIRVKY